MSDTLLDDLAKGLKPVKPLRMWPVWIGAGIGLVLAGLYIWFIYHPRAELHDLVMHGTWPTNPVAIAKPLLFLALGISGLWAVSGLARPQGRMKLRYLLPVLVLCGITFGNLISEIMIFGWEDIGHRLNGGVTVCFTTILCGGMAGLIVLWRLWLRKTATSHPVTLGAMSGLATASLMAAAYALHCNMDAPVYIVAVYGLAVAVFTGFAALLGGKLLKW